MRNSVHIDITPDRWRSVASDPDRLGKFVTLIARSTHALELRISRKKLVIVALLSSTGEELIFTSPNLRKAANEIAERVCNRSSTGPPLTEHKIEISGDDPDKAATDFVEAFNKHTFPVGGSTKTP